MCRSYKFSQEKHSLEAKLMISKHESCTTTPDTIKHEHVIRVHVAQCTCTSAAYKLKHCGQRNDFTEISLKWKLESWFPTEISRFRNFTEILKFHNFRSRMPTLVPTDLWLMNFLEHGSFRLWILIYKSMVWQIGSQFLWLDPAQKQKMCQKNINKFSAISMSNCPGW